VFFSFFKNSCFCFILLLLLFFTFVSCTHTNGQQLCMKQSEALTYVGTYICVRYTHTIYTHCCFTIWH
jgi:hypothetical protein